MAREAILEEIHRFLREHAEAEYRAGQRRFFQHEVATYGVRSEDLKLLARQVYASVKAWPEARRNRLMNELWKDPRLEPGAVAIYVYRRFARVCRECEFRLFERWIDRYVRNWGHCDGVSAWLIAAAIANQPELRHELLEWTASPNRWKRRAAAVGLIQEARQGRGTETIFAVADRLIDVRDDMVEKGVGWLLKETYPRRADETVQFLLPRRERASRLTLRYAAEKMTMADRARVLGR